MQDKGQKGEKTKRKGQERKEGERGMAEKWGGGQRSTQPAADLQQ